MGQGRKRDWTGVVIDKITVLNQAPRVVGNPVIFWNCVCVCGEKVLKGAGCLRRIERLGKGACMSCSNSKHGISIARSSDDDKRLYRIWKNIRYRCSNPNADEYKYYGGKGVVLCNEWDDFSRFREWAFANKYKDGLCIDRVDSDGDYEPSNCEWVTPSENSKRMAAKRWGSK